LYSGPILEDGRRQAISFQLKDPTSGAAGGDTSGILIFVSLGQAGYCGLVYLSSVLEEIQGFMQCWGSSSTRNIRKQ
jgi:hypothetical protein